MNKIKGDILILGAGIVGLSIAYRLVERGVQKYYPYHRKKKRLDPTLLGGTVAYFIPVFTTNLRL